MKVFRTKEEAEKYANKNYFRGTYQIEETINENFRIIKNNQKSFAEAKFFLEAKNG